MRLVQKSMPAVAAVYGRRDPACPQIIPFHEDSSGARQARVFHLPACAAPGFSRRLWLFLCVTLLLGAGVARAETVLWSDNFDTNAAPRWQAAGAWKIGSPTAGPPLNGAGQRAFSGANCASTQKYAGATDGRIVCINYNGASSLVVPAASQYPRLRFWQWFAFNNALGYVEISTDSGASWNQLSQTYLNLNGGGVWSRPYYDLTPYAGQSVRIAFHFTSGGTGNGLGWFVDDVEVATGTPVLNFPESFEFDPKMSDWSEDQGTWQIGHPTSGPGSAHTGTNCAATMLSGNYSNNVDSRLLSPPFAVPAAGGPALRFWHWYSFNNALGYVEVNVGSVSTVTVTNTTITTNTAATLNTNVYQFYGAQNTFYSSPLYWNPTIGGWTNNVGRVMGFVFDYSLGVTQYDAGPAPLALVGAVGYVDYRATNSGSSTFPPLPGGGSGGIITNPLDLQGLAWVSATVFGDYPVGYFGTNTTDTYTTNTTVTTYTNTSDWTQLSPTYENSASGGWSDVSLDLTPYEGQTVRVAFHFTSGGEYTDPGWYVDDLSLAVVPVLTVPTNQLVFAGDDLVVTNYVTNSYDPNAVYTFGLVSPPAGMSINNQGVLTWQVGSNQPSSTNTITVAVEDNSNPPLVATNSFVVTVLNQWIPDLTVPPTQTIYAGQDLTVTVSATNEIGDTLTFDLLSGLNNANAALDESNFTNNGVLSWETTTLLKAGTYTNIIVATDASSGISATNRFAIVVSNAIPPVLTVPGRQVIYAGQNGVFTCSASSVYDTNSIFTFQLLSALQTNMDVSELTNNGELRWATAFTQRTGSYTNIIKVTDSVSSLSASNSFVIVVSNALAPKLTVPVNQAIYAGQTLTVTNTASSVYGTNFAFQLLSAVQPGMDISGLANNGVLRWATAFGQAAAKYTNTIKVTDSVSSLAATNSFVIVVSNTLPPALTVPGKQTIFAGEKVTVTNSATSVYGTNFTFQLLSGLTNANAGLDESEFTNNGVLSWATTAAQPAGNYTNVVEVTDNASQLSTNKSFVIVVSNAVPPTLTVPAKQTIYAGQKLTVTNSASSVYGTNSIFTFQLLSVLLPNMDISSLSSNGVLSWATATGQAAGNYTNTIKVTDSASQLSATNSFVIAVATNPPAPRLNVPPTQTIYAGQTMIVTNRAYYTNSAWPSCAFTFSLVSPTNNLDVSNLATNGVLRWATTIAQTQGTFTNTVMVVDGLTHLSATSNFLVQVLPPQPPTLLVPPTQSIYAGQLMAVTISATNSAYPGDTFTYSAFGPSNLDVSGLSHAGVLKWTPTAAQADSMATIYVMATEHNSLSTNSSFMVLVFPTPQSSLTVSPTRPGPGANGFEFTINTMPDTTWRVDASTNLLNWWPIATNVADPDGSLQFTDPAATNFPQRYYRAVVP